jgi:hypothetical protein
MERRKQLLEQIIGNFIEQEEDGEEYLLVRFSPTSLPLRQRWRNSGLSADFLAEYWATFFPATDVPSRNKQREIKGAINYIANELLENIMKFNYQTVDYAVGLGLYLYENEFRFYSSNAVDPKEIDDFQQRIETLLTEDTQKLYVEQVERNVSEDRPGSGLGLLTMVNDYGARLAWKFEAIALEPAFIVVTTMVQLDLK